ncbi:MAG: DUF1844 domain-containing protein [Myxococcota bacterium]
MADAHQSTGSGEHDAGLSFAAFVLSLAHTTAVHLGDVPDPAGARPSPNLAAAQQMIDILSLLEQKTRGNLSAEERQLLEQVLYELRLRFVEVRGAGTPAGGGDASAARSEDTRVPRSGSRTPSGIIIP